MTNAERNKLAAAIFELRGNPHADQNTVIALAQAIERAFDADPKFSNFAVSATALFTNIDYRKKLAERAAREADDAALSTTPVALWDQKGVVA